MNVLLKWILIVIAVFVLLLIVAAVVLPLTFDPNNYKQQIARAVKEETGRDLTMAGDIGWTVFPWLGFEVNDVTLGNREGFGAEPMLVIGQAGASVKIMPLFSKNIEIGKVTLTDMSVNLSQKANGENNWADLGDRESADSSGKSSSGDSTFKSIQISGIEISNTNVRWNDAGQVTELKNFNLSASGIADQQPFDLKGSFTVALPDPQMDGDVKFSGHVIPPAGSNSLRIDGLKLSFNGKQGAIPDIMTVNLAISADATVNTEQDSARLDNFKLRLHKMDLSGDLSVTSLSDEPVIKGALTVAKFSPRTLMKDLGMTPPVTSHPDALTHFSAHMNFTGSANGTDWRDLSMTLDQSNIDGRFKLSNFDQPDLDFDLRIDSIDLDNYLPPADASAASSDSSAKASPGNSQTSVSESDLTSEDFRSLNGGGKFTIGQLKIMDLTATEVSTTMSANRNGWRFYPTVANFYGGKNVGDIRIDATGSRPILTISEDLSGVQAEGLLADITGTASRLLGTGSLKLDIRTDLSNPTTFKNTLSGDLSLSVADGALVGIDVADTLNQARSLLGKQSQSTAQLSDDARTEFALMGMTGQIKNGILSSDDFDLSSTLLRATGKGQINLVDATIDYVVRPVLSENVRGEGRSTLGKLSTVAVPIKISGNLSDPKISIDFVAAAVDSQKEKIEEKKTELTDKLLDRLLGSDKDKDADIEGKQGHTPDAPSAATGTGAGPDAGPDADPEAGTKANEEPVDALIDSLFSSKKDRRDRKKQKRAEKEQNQPEAAAGQPEDTATEDTASQPQGMASQPEAG